MDDGRRARALLLAGAAVGIGLAAVGLVRGGELPAGLVASGEIARVNGAPILRAELERVVDALAADKRGPLEEADRARALERLIEEELLVQRGVEIGLLDSEPGVRKALVQALVYSVVAEAESEEPDPAALRAFYDEHREYFGAGERLRIERLVFRTEGGRPGAPAQRAREAREALAGGEDPEAVRRRLADEPILPVPPTLLPLAKLREYLGNGALERLAAAPEGAWSEPLEDAEGIQLLRIAERRGPEAHPYGAVADQVAAEWRRREGDRALREYLAFLRAQAEVTLAPDAPR
jgi:hypothetical protein